MRILHCIDTQEVAGTERHVAELAAFQARGHEVTVLIGRRTADPFTGEDIISRLCAPVETLRAGRSGYGAALAALTRRRRFDIVHTHLGRASFRARWLAARRPALIATLHNRYAPRAYGGHDGLICIARWQAERVTGKHLAVIGNWTQAGPPEPVRRAALRAEFGIGADEFLIGAAGRFVPEKRFDLLIEAFRHAGLPGARLILFGAGPEESRLRGLADSGVIFGGYRADLPGDLAGLDGFVLPSRREPFGLVLLEAMAARLPVCATGAGGVTDILAEAPDCLVPPEDVGALAEGLRRLRRQGARDWALDRWRLPVRAAEIETFYRSVVAMRRR
ncbi:glycosyltransferase [Acidomonas methanolica]|uniref:Lipopolysaccharide core biosynthesis glycosyl transferase n=1 Tax=Acidomonas methanolica NBRC 104435 TaxID=1231351 RepID=A0A023D2X0_ACIMT|nr:glycosyltransferase [Acidomonas methanolica]MBU2654545.1 glycosyltransferase [Acidomonas methanolica]TCS27418.1 glycosyltransferase involved in cell wall biosynthesis [Acidomonas methanolica]GAJ28100.1 lipopolysaccharide core biosynthesis glycosyl transferase [Acidomonas methanolica NBRC 104435]GBQ47280.1 lipopolysaccharide core biosynthesis glycosyl transferase [Acidomonas methanolica]GEK98674.1 hypothetical protein AME01nite_11730 [Acidomonas methanolica NBRC 104435]